MKDEVFCCLVDKMLNETVNSHKGVPRIFFRILSSDQGTSRTVDQGPRALVQFRPPANFSAKNRQISKIG